MARLYADENVPEALNDELRALGHDVLSVAQSGRAGDDDAKVLTDATDDGRIVLTFNRWDFERLHRKNGAHEGILSCSKDDDLAALAARIDAALATQPKVAGKHIRVNRPSTP